VVALAFPAAALAVRYLGPIVPQVNDDGVEIDVALNGKGAPNKVVQVEWHNVPNACESSEIFYKKMRVTDHKFHGSGHPGEAGNPDWPPDPNIIETITGHFKHHNHKIVGTLRIQGAAGTGCEGTDTGKLPYVAHHRS
jgi:hypothetical protein